MAPAGSAYGHICRPGRQRRDILTGRALEHGQRRLPEHGLRRAGRWAWSVAADTRRCCCSRSAPGCPGGPRGPWFHARSGACQLVRSCDLLGTSVGRSLTVRRQRDGMRCGRAWAGGRGSMDRIPMTLPPATRTTAATDAATANGVDCETASSSVGDRASSIRGGDLYVGRAAIEHGAELIFQVGVVHEVSPYSAGIRPRSSVRARAARLRTVARRQPSVSAMSTSG